MEGAHEGGEGLESHFWLTGAKRDIGSCPSVAEKGRTQQRSQVCTFMCLRALCVWFLYTFHLCHNKPPNTPPWSSLSGDPSPPQDGRDEGGRRDQSRGLSWWSLQCSTFTWLDLRAAVLPVLRRWNSDGYSVRHEEEKSWQAVSSLLKGRLFGTVRLITLKTEYMFTPK